MTIQTNDIESILYSESTIKTRVNELGNMLTADYLDKSPLVICALKGAAVFYADLCRCMSCALEMEFMRVSSYRNGTTSGDLIIKKDIECDVSDRHVIIVDDIMDSGRTLLCLKQLINERKAKSVAVVAMFNKPARRACDISPDYSGFDVPDGFLVGYGLDYAERYRNLPYVGILKREIYEN